LFSFLSKNHCETAKRTRKEAAEKEQELLRQKQKEQEEMMEAQERSFHENMAQLQQKWEMERKNILKEQERMLQHKLKVNLNRTWKCLTKSVLVP
jgi:hypothetical protein